MAGDGFMQRILGKINSELDWAVDLDALSSPQLQDFEEKCRYYADSYLYFLRATRDDFGNLGKLSKRGNTTFGLGYRNGAVYLVRPDGSDAVEQVRSLAFFIKRQLNIPVVLKKVGLPMADELKGVGFRSQPSFSSSALLEDEMFPEQMIELDGLLLECGQINPQARNFRKKFRTFAKRRAPLLARSVVGLGQISELLAQIRKRLDHTGQKIYSYKAILEIALAANAPRQRRYVATAFYDGANFLEGIYVAHLLDDKRAGIYCALSSRASEGITEWMDATFIRSLCHAGIKEILLGGSETVGVYDYVRKLRARPVDPPMEPLLYG
jgi:hypothetical protein